jgi:hypothetical protein
VTMDNASLRPVEAGGRQPSTVLGRYGLVTRRHPFDGVVGRLQNHGFPTDPATQATGLRLLPRWDCLPQNAPAFAGRTTAALEHALRLLELPQLAGQRPSMPIHQPMSLQATSGIGFIHTNLPSDAAASTCGTISAPIPSATMDSSSDFLESSTAL